MVNYKKAIGMFGCVVAVLILSGCNTNKTTIEKSSNEDKEITTTTKPNILWLIAEDMSPDLPSYGTKGLTTPTIDKLANEGMRYTNAYMTAPICSIARSALMTGMYQTSINSHHHRTYDDDKLMLPEGVDILTNWVKPAGYYTANLVDLTGKGKDEDFYYGSGKTDWNFKYISKTTGKGDVAGFDGNSFADLKANTPFFAQVNFDETHRGHAWDNSDHYIDQPAKPEDIDLPPYYADSEVTRAEWVKYYNSIMALDKKIAYILKRLETEGLADNTIVIFMSDHGRAMPRGKQFLYEAGLKIPLIIRYPDSMAKPAGFVVGGTNDDMIQGIDIAATTLQLADVEIPSNMHGKVFLPRIEPAPKYAYGARGRADETVDYMRSIRDHKFRYIKNYMPERAYTQLNRYKVYRYPELRELYRLKAAGKLTPAQTPFMADTKPVEELYDIAADPHQLNNLADDKNYIQELTRLRQALVDWEESTNDQQRSNPVGTDLKSYFKKARKKDARIKALLKEEGYDYNILLQQEQSYLTQAH